MDKSSPSHSEERSPERILSSFSGLHLKSATVFAAGANLGNAFNVSTPLYIAVATASDPNVFHIVNESAINSNVDLISPRAQTKGSVDTSFSTTNVSSPSADPIAPANTSKRPIESVDTSSSTEQQTDKAAKLTASTSSTSDIVLEETIVPVKFIRAKSILKSTSLKHFKRVDFNLIFKPPQVTHNNNGSADEGPGGSSSKADIAPSMEVALDEHASVPTASPLKTGLQAAPPKAVPHTSGAPAAPKKSLSTSLASFAAALKAAKTQGTPSINKEGQDDIEEDQEEEEEERPAILSAAEPAWQAHKQHRAAEQRAKLRAQHFIDLIEKDVLPGPSTGADRLPRYLIQDGQLPTPLLLLIRSQARERVSCIVDLLRDQEAREKRTADRYQAYCRDLYTDAGRLDDLGEVEELLASLVGHYRVGEKKRLEAQAKRELDQKPQNDARLSSQMVRDVDAFKIPLRQYPDRQGARQDWRPKSPYKPKKGTKRMGSRSPKPQPNKGKRGKSPQQPQQQPSKKYTRANSPSENRQRRNQQQRPQQQQQKQQQRQSRNSRRPSPQRQQRRRNSPKPQRTPPVTLSVGETNILKALAALASNLGAQE